MATPRLLALFPATILCVACSEAPAPPTDGGKVSDANAAHQPALGHWIVETVDSVPYANELNSGYHRKVRVGTATGFDTLAGVLVDQLPVVVGDSILYGIRAEQDDSPGLFTYSRSRRQLRMLPPLEGWQPFQEPEIAPDGAHVAFLAKDSTDNYYGAVATLPAGKVMFRGPPMSPLETDTGIDEISWSDANHFEIDIAITYKVGGKQRIRGSLSPLKVTIDTMRDRPQ
jgi:hypothetical protein